MTNKNLLSGNAAIARGAIEAGVSYAASYPGTPSTEILESLINQAKEFNIRCDWAVNEKVALETAIGVSLGGARSIVSMKNVGLNLAADPLFTLAYTGINSGLVIAVCDDPGPQSSQNEQDSRYYAKAAGVPCLEPSDQQEAKEMTKEAFQISEKFDLPVLIRPTTRLSHSSGVVELGKINSLSKEIEITPEKYVMIPKHARERHKILIKKQALLQEYSNNARFNKLELRGKRGLIASGIIYSHLKELLSELNLDFSILKLGITHPLPNSLIKSLIDKSEKTLIIEELEPYIEEHSLQFGPSVLGKEYIPRHGEITSEIIIEGLNKAFNLNLDLNRENKNNRENEKNPKLCPGCPHRALYYSLNKLKNVIVTGDIGCYTLGALPPLSAIKTQMCMGSGINHAAGLYHRGISRHPIAVIGDSTFIHSGITGLINAVYTQAKITIIILDNRTTAMTGFQPHPGTGKDAVGKSVEELNLEKIAYACNAKFVTIVDPYNVKETLKALKKSLNVDGVSVIISRSPCILLEKPEGLYKVTDNCTFCKKCIAELDCPAIIEAKEKIEIDSELCTGCGLCEKVCPEGAIIKE